MDREIMEEWKDKYPVLLDHLIYAKAKGIAKVKGVTVEEWVNESLRKAVKEAPEANEAFLQAIRRASEVYAPTADIDQMIREIESGYLDNGYVEE